MVDRGNDGRDFQKFREVALATVRNSDGLDFVGVLFVELLDPFVGVQPVDLPIGLPIVQDHLVSDFCFLKVRDPTPPTHLSHGSRPMHKPYAPRRSLRSSLRQQKSRDYAQRSK